MTTFLVFLGGLSLGACLGAVIAAICAAGARADAARSQPTHTLRAVYDWLDGIYDVDQDGEHQREYPPGSGRILDLLRREITNR